MTATAIGFTKLELIDNLDTMPILKWDEFILDARRSGMLDDLCYQDILHCRSIVHNRRESAGYHEDGGTHIWHGLMVIVLVDGDVVCYPEVFMPWKNLWQVAEHHGVTINECFIERGWCARCSDPEWLGPFQTEAQARLAAECHNPDCGE